MSLLVLMYHRARAERFGNSPTMLDAHFAEVAARTVNVLPGEKLATDRINVCLSFDDGYFDFWAVVFPLLKKHGLRAVLAVSPGVVRETVTASSDERLQMPTETAYAKPNLGGFCTWNELSGLAKSGHVEIAAHGFTHTRLDFEQANLETEVQLAKTTLDSRLNKSINTFVFPFGRFSPEALRQAQLSYAHIFRIGSASNRDWSNKVTYRIPADGMKDPGELFSWARRVSYSARFRWNRIRGR